MTAEDIIAVRDFADALEAGDNGSDLLDRRILAMRRCAATAEALTDLKRDLTGDIDQLRAALADPTTARRSHADLHRTAEALEGIVGKLP